MEKLIKDGTDETPQVILDSENNKFEISGKSMPEDSTAFYRPILEWLTQYAAAPNRETNFILKMFYFNTSSSKLLLDVLFKIEEISQHGAVKIIWQYDIDDEDMLEAGKEYANMVEVPFEFVSYVD